jgi:hypothetical protein
MMDFAFVAVLAGFAALSLLLIALCDVLIGASRLAEPCRMRIEGEVIRVPRESGSGRP